MGCFGKRSFRSFRPKFWFRRPRLQYRSTSSIVYNQLNSTLAPPEQDLAHQIYVANYSYENYKVEGDLAFKKGDYLEIIERFPAGWWKARRLGTNTVGYIPSNFVTPLESIETEPWYFGNISRHEGTNRLLMSGNQNGSFLIREPETGTHKYTLSVLIGRDVKHFRVKEQSGLNGQSMLFIGNSVKFETLPGLIDYYRYDHKNSLGTKLTVPCLKMSLMTLMMREDVSLDYRDFCE